jgi:hypothetical protein
MVCPRNLVLIGLATLVVAGCSDADGGRLAVSGTVKFKGETLKAGIISFEPLDNQDTFSGAPIENGRYEIPRPQGLKPGKYRVRVSAGDGVTPAIIAGAKEKDNAEAAGPGGSTNIISRELIPPSWNTQSKQEVTIAYDNTRFEFDIPPK